MLIRFRKGFSCQENRTLWLAKLTDTLIVSFGRQECDEIEHDGSKEPAEDDMVQYNLDNEFFLQPDTSDRSRGVKYRSGSVMAEQLLKPAGSRHIEILIDIEVDRYETLQV